MFESEKGILSCILQDNSLIYNTLEYITNDCFLSPKNKYIFRVLQKEIIENKKIVDVVHLNEIIIRNKINIKTSYLTDILEISPSKLLLDRYVKEVIKIITEAKIKNLFLKYKDIKADNIDILDNELKQIVSNYRESNFKSDIFEPRQYAYQAMDRYAEYQKNPKNIRGIKTGFKKIDNNLKGLKTLNIISAPSGIGKTTLGLNWAVNIVLEEKLPILYINFEMSPEELLKRIVSIVSCVPSNVIESGKYEGSNCSYSDVSGALNKIHHTNRLFFTGNKTKDINATISMIYQYVEKHKIKVVFIDYIGEISHDQQALKERNEYTTYGRYAQELKNTCADLDVKCVLISQLGREGDDVPTRKNVQGSWKLVQKADIFAILYYSKDKGSYVFKIEKNRHGKSYTNILLDFNQDIHTFTEGFESYASKNKQ